MTGVDSAEGGSAGSSNVLQDDVNGNGNDVVNGNVENSAAEESFHSTQTATESLTSTTISVCSQSDLLIPGKLFNDISKLKSCYIDILKETYASVKTTVAVTEADVLTLTREQLADYISKTGKDKMRAQAAKEHLLNMLELIRPVCVPDFQEDTRPKRKPAECQINELSSNIQLLSSRHSEQFETLTAELQKLQSTVANYESILTSAPAPSTHAPQLIEIPTDASPAELDIPHIDKTIDSYLSESQCNDLHTELSNLPFSRETGRLTMKFGEHYEYNGSRGESTVEFPPHLKALLDKLNDQFVSSETPHLNSCVVNKYVGPNSFIPSHSDDERSIHPESDIFTMSIGKEATVHFTSLGKSLSHQHIATNGSLYSMSRQSQGCYRHKVNKNSSWAADDVRLSLTFRSVHWRNNNSTIILGDSNTGGLKFACFGEESPKDYNGTFGNALPGRRDATFIVDEIDAAKCVGFNNIVVHCGVNDIRKPEVESDENVRNIYVKFKSKINQILHLNKNSRVFVSLLLPTKLDVVNKKIKLFNKLIIDDLCISFNNRVKTIDAHKRLCDINGLLASNLSREFNRDNQPDHLHLNDGGLKVLSVAIKRVLFFSKRQEGSSRRSGGVRGSGSDREPVSGSFAEAASRPSRGGRRGGHNRRGRGGARRP